MRHKSSIKSIIMDTLPRECKSIIESSDFNDKVCIWTGNWDCKDCDNSPEALFLFGDNDQGKGTKGQAIIRYCKNVMGIPTKKIPSYAEEAYYNDNEYEDNCKKIHAAIINIIKSSTDYKELVFPEKGFGCGLAKLNTKAPKTFKFLVQIINDCFGIDYQDILKNGLQITVDMEKLKMMM